MLRISRFLLLGLLLLAMSCSDLSLFSPPARQSSSIEVRSLNEGGIVQSGQTISFVLHGDKDEKEPLTLEITLSNASGENVWSNSLAAPLLEEELALSLPSLAAGEYKLKFIMSRASAPAGEKEITFFYTAGSFAINGISSYPPAIQPGARILLRADLAYPAGSDPYLRWMQGSVVIGKGRLSEGLSQLTWQAPKAEGVYSIQVELFPTAPTGEKDFPFTSALVLTAKLYIAAGSSASSDELSPRESYYSLFHFDGSLRDTGALAAGAASATAEAFGAAAAASDRDGGGYRLSGNAGIRYPRLILPVKDGQLQPFTLTLGLALEEPDTAKSILSISNEDPRFALRLFIDGQGKLAALLRSPSGGEVLLASGIDRFPDRKVHRLDLSLVPSAKALTVLWFLDGNRTSSLTAKADVSGLSTEGETLIGGESSFSGRITELGVYFQDEQNRASPDPAIFRTAMERRYDRSLVLAEGFEGLYLPEGFTLSPPESGRLEEGNMLMEPGANLALPFFELAAQRDNRQESTAVEIAFAEPLPAGSGVSLYWEGEAKAFLEIRPEGKMLLPGKPQELASFAPLTDSLSLLLSADQITLHSSQGPVSLALPKPGTRERWLSLRIHSPAQGSAVKIDRILVYQKIAS